MKKSFCIIALLALTCTLFTGCKKEDGGPDSKEDLSYLLMTYRRYSSGNHVYKTEWTYDGYKVMGIKDYEDGLLKSECKNYSYDGLNASYDSYFYRDGDVNDISVTHYECEYLDETFQRTKYQKYYSPNSENNINIFEIYYEYDGKKKLSHKNYTNGILTGESQYNYDGLRCTYKNTSYHSSSNTIALETSYDIVYLDDTYLRWKSYKRTREYYDENGNLTRTHIYFVVYDIDGKKTIGFQSFSNGELSGVGRDYHYDGLTCTYFIDTYQDGEVVSTESYEVEYLE